MKLYKYAFDRAGKESLGQIIKGFLSHDPFRYQGWHMELLHYKDWVTEKHLRLTMDMYFARTGQEYNQDDRIEHNLIDEAIEGSAVSSLRELFYHNLVRMDNLLPHDDVRCRQIIEKTIDTYNELSI